MSSKKIAAAKKQKAQTRKNATATSKKLTINKEKEKDDYLGEIVGEFERMKTTDSNGSGRMIVDFKKNNIPANKIGKDYLSKILEALEKKLNTAPKSEITADEVEEEEEEDTVEQSDEDDSEQHDCCSHNLSKEEHDFMEQFVAAFEENERAFAKEKQRVFDPVKIKRQLEENKRKNEPIFKRLYELFESVYEGTELEKTLKSYADRVQEHLKKPGCAEKYYKQPHPTFWFNGVGPETALGFMINSATNSGTTKHEALERFYKPWVVMWLPHLLPTVSGGKLKCPRDNCHADLKSTGFTNSFPFRKVFGVQARYYVMTHTYNCTGKTVHIVDGLDNKVANQLFILGSSMECPIAYANDKFAVDRQLDQSTTMYRKCGMELNQILETIKQMHVKKLRDDIIYSDLAKKRLADEEKKAGK